MAELQEDTEVSPVLETDIDNPQPPPGETGPDLVTHDSSSPEPPNTPTRPEQPLAETAAQVSGPAEPAEIPSPRLPHPHTFHGPVGKGQSSSVQQVSRNPPPLTLNQLAIVTASQNKLPTSNVKSIVRRMGRHTQSSASKRGCWYKGDNYVDGSFYSWRNLELFTDYQKHMYTPAGTVKTTCTK